MREPLNIAACEDMRDDLAFLLSCVEESGIPAVCEPFPSGEGLLAAFSPGKYDLIFLDIYMDGMRGIDAAAKIRETDNGVMLVFTTTSTEHALESYRLKALCYLEKPVKPAEVKEAMELALRKRGEAPCITLLIEGQKRDIPLERILYFEQQNHAVMVNTLTDTLRTSQTVKLKQIEELLPDTFLRCHHSFIANLKHVKSLDRELKTFVMQNGDSVYIRQQSLRAAARTYEEYLFRKTRGGKV